MDAWQSIPVIGTKPLNCFECYTLKTTQFRGEMGRQFGNLRVHSSTFPNPFPKNSPMASPKKTATGRWHVQIEIAGVRESATFDTKAQASIWAAQRSTELRMLATGQAGKLKTLKDALRRYAEEVSPTKKGARAEQIRLKAFERPEHAPLPVQKKLIDITPEDLGAWRDARFKLVSAGSVLRDMTTLGSVLEHARREWRWITTNPIRDVRRPREPMHRERIITDTEVRTMLKTLGWSARRGPRSVTHAVAWAFVFALQTGMRAGEICALTPDDVHADHVKVKDGKTGARVVPLTATAKRTLAAMAGFDPSTIFGLDPRSMDALFRRHREKTGLTGFTFHDARHTAATRLAQRLHVLELCKVFGWKNTTRALTYYNPNAADLAKRMAG